MLAWKEVEFIGVEKKGYVISIAALLPATEVVATQSVSVMTLKPFSQACPPHAHLAQS
jgi:hypothetical protein